MLVKVENVHMIKLKKKIAKGLNVSRSVVVCYFQRKLKINFLQVCGT